MSDLRAAARNNFLNQHGWGDAEIKLLAADASFRQYFRLTRGDETSILMDAPPDAEETTPFIHVTQLLHDAGLNAPDILAKDQPNGFLLLQDFGDARFTRILSGEHSMANAPNEHDLYQAAMDVLLDLHAAEIDMASLAPYDENEYTRELQLLLDWYYPFTHTHDLPEHAAAQFYSLWKKLLTMLEPHRQVLVMRDYHADNLMWLPDESGTNHVGLLDYQDALIGHPAYDIVSLLDDIRRDVSAELAEEMLARYIAQTGVDAEAFRRDAAILSAQRNLKILGIFTRLSVRDGKHHYLDMLPRVWQILERLLAHPALELLKQWLDLYFPQELRTQDHSDMKKHA